MARRISVLFATVIMGSVTQFLYKKLVLVLGSSLVSVSRFMHLLFCFISSFLFSYRLHGNGGSLRQNFEDSEIISTGKTNQKEQPELVPEAKAEPEPTDVGFKAVEPELEMEHEPDAKTDEVGFAESEDDCEAKKLEFSFTFRFPTFEEFSKSKKGNSELFNSDSVLSTTSSKYNFMPCNKSYCGFIEEPEVVSFNVERVDASDTNLEHSTVEAAETFDQKKSVDGGETEKNVATNSKPQETGDYFHYFEKDSVVVTDGDSGSVNFEPEASVVTGSIRSYDDGFLSDEDFGDEFKVVSHDLDASNSMDGEYSRGEMSDWDKDAESDYFGEADSDIMDELSKLEGELLEQDLEHDPEVMTSPFLSEEDFHEDSNETKAKADKDDKPMNDSYDSEKLKTKEACDLEDSNKLETLWEHQDLIEQLKMELRKVRATGLPTILEESESPKIMEDLKPWKIDDKFQREDCMDELHKFYKSYAERMRKFDIFNYQKMYAIVQQQEAIEYCSRAKSAGPALSVLRGFLQLKDPLQPISSSKTSGPTLKSLLSQNFWQLKHKSSDNEPMIEFIKELQSDLEVVYVGQMCLSWEFLHWQYGKALDLWDSDPRGIHRYNEVAGEFQQFQVLMQRFIEDEHFQGPRVQYYIKRRCLLRNLLQVPVIREDNLKDKRKGRRGEIAEYVITSDMMVEIIEESIRIFWRFVRADKDCNSAVSKGHKGAPAQLQNPGDLELLMEIKRILQKKERKLKDMVRSGNCILRRFRRNREDDSDHVLYFFSQVDMKLVSRVLNMTRITTDQLVWCHSKLSRISFENRKIQVEPSFLLFPC